MISFDSREIEWMGRVREMKMREGVVSRLKLVGVVFFSEKGL